VLAVAASVIYFGSVELYSDVVNRDYFAEYVETTHTTFLQSTVNESWYLDTTNNLKILEDKSVQELVCEILFLKNNGSGIDKKSIEKGMESKINAILKNLTQPYFQYRYTAVFEDVNITLQSTSIFPEERYAATIYLTMPYQAGTAISTLYIWK
jgi:hypothetical protein